MASKLTLDGGVALVTGAARGIGKETALAFAEANTQHVVFADIIQKEAEDAAAESKALAKHPSYEALALKVDVANEASVQAMVDATVKKFQRIDYFVNSAGLGSLSGAVTKSIKVDIFDKIINTNLKGTMLTLRAVSGAMAKQEPRSHQGRKGPRNLGRGSIVCLGSIASYAPPIGGMAYAASKHAVVGMCRVAAVDNVRDHIRVNAVCPGWTDTPMVRAGFEKKPDMEKIASGMSPLGRMAEPEEIADYIVFLSSPSASYINGTGLVLDSGTMLGPHT